MSATLHIQTSKKIDGNMDSRWSESPQEVIENRKKFLTQFNLQLEDCAIMELEHKDKILVVDHSHKYRELKDDLITEAFITQEKGLVLFLMTADCLPIAFYDPITESLALAHLSWRSTDLELSKKVIARMKEKYQVELENVQVFIGPCIHKESYIHKAPLEKHSQELDSFISELYPGDFSIDLVGCNIAQMVLSGIKPEKITVASTDVAISPEYFSHYRSIRTGEREGRFATIAWLD